MTFANKLQNLHIDHQAQQFQQFSRELISYFSTFSRYFSQFTAQTQSTSKSADYHIQTSTRQSQKFSKKKKSVNENDFKSDKSADKTDRSKSFATNRT